MSDEETSHGNDPEEMSVGGNDHRRPRTSSHLSPLKIEMSSDGRVLPPIRRGIGKGANGVGQNGSVDEGGMDNEGLNGGVENGVMENGISENGAVGLVRFKKALGTMRTKGTIKKKSKMDLANLVMVLSSEGEWRSPSLDL